MSSFNTIAAYYEVLSDAEGRLDREGPLLSECLRRAPGARVVDVACGTGLHARLFADLGARVTAFDLSPEMVAYAREHRLHPAITYAVGDMRDLKGGPWDLAVCLGNSLSLLGSLEEVVTLFRSVAGSLSRGGVFALQVLNYAAEAAQRPRHRIERRTRGDIEIIAVKNLVPHGDRTLLSITFFIKEDGTYASASDTAVLLPLSREDLARGAEQAGLRVNDVFGGFDRSPYEPAISPDLIAVLIHP